MRFYTAYGLQVASELALPELLSTRRVRPDVTIRYGSVPKSLQCPLGEGVVFQAKQGQFLLVLEDIASYWVCNGNEIHIERAPESADEDVRLFLLGSAFGALLHQRGVLPLHGSAIETSHGAAVFAGHSGYGKSTLASAFYLRGYRILTDDVCAITLEAGTPMVWPSYPRLHVWADVLDKLNQSLPRTQVRAKLDKYGIPVGTQYAVQPLPLDTVYELQPVNTLTTAIEPVDESFKFDVLLNHTYRRQFVAGLGLQQQHFQRVVDAAQPIKVRRVARPQEGFALEALVEQLETDFQAG